MERRKTVRPEGATGAEIPTVIEPKSLNDYFEVMTRAVFQAGVAWKQISAHWDAYRVAFEEFDPTRVARYGEFDVERILETPGVLRMPRKIRATIKNAGTIVSTDNECGGFAQYLKSFGSYPALAKDFRSRFTLLGEMSAWYFLFRVGEPVPRFEEWVKSIPGEHPRMREMVEKARESRLSREIVPQSGVSQ